MIALELLIDESCNKDLLHSKETLNLTTHKLVTELQIKSLKLWYDSTQLEIETALKQNSKYSISSNTTPINPLIVALKNKIKWEKAYTYHKKTDSTKLLNVAVPIFYDSRNGFYVRLATTLDYTTHKKTAYFIVSLMDSLFFVHHKEAAFNDKFSGAFVVYNLEGRREALLHYKNGMRNAQGQQAQHTFKYSAKTAEFQNTLSGVYLRKTEFTNVLMNCNPPCIVDSWMWCCECGDGVVTDISCNNDWWNSNPNLIEDLPGVIVDGSYPSSGGGGYPDLGGGYYPPPPDNGDGGGGSSSNDSDPVEVDPCDATKRAAAQNATNQSQQTNYNAAKGEISAAGNDREHTITIDANGNKSTMKSGLETGNNVKANWSYPNAVAVLHNHPCYGTQPPSAGDVYSLIRNNAIYPNITTLYVLGCDGDEYALIITDPTLAQQFVRDFPKLVVPGLSPKFSGDAVSDYNNISDFGFGHKDAHEAALAHVVNKYVKGMSFVKKNSETGNFDIQKTEIVLDTKGKIIGTPLNPCN